MVHKGKRTRLNAWRLQWRTISLESQNLAIIRYIFFERFLHIFPALNSSEAYPQPDESSEMTAWISDRAQIIRTR